MTPQQASELDALPNKIEYDLDELRAAAPSLVGRIDFEVELSREDRGRRNWFRAWTWKSLAVDLLVYGALLIALGLGCEVITRRWTAAKESATSRPSADPEPSSSSGHS